LLGQHALSAPGSLTEANSLDDLLYTIALVLCWTEALLDNYSSFGFPQHGGTFRTSSIGEPTSSGLLGRFRETFLT
jgi:hypothetical protein